MLQQFQCSNYNERFFFFSILSIVNVHLTLKICKYLMIYAHPPNLTFEVAIWTLEVILRCRLYLINFIASALDAPELESWRIQTDRQIDRQTDGQTDRREYAHESDIAVMYPINTKLWKWYLLDPCRLRGIVWICSNDMNCAHLNVAISMENDV